MEEKSICIRISTSENPVKLAVHKETTVEEIVVTVCHQINIGPIARHLFALSYEKIFWTSLNTKLWEYKHSEFNLRIRYKVPNLSRLQKLDKNAYNYYFFQVREDINNNMISDISYEKHKKELIGLGVTDMYREMLEKNISEEEVVNNYTKFIPKESLKCHRIFLKRPIQKALTEIRANSCDALSLKTAYLEQAEQMAPNYMIEEYEALINDGNDKRIIKIIVKPFDKEMPGIKYFVGNKEWKYVCSIEDLCDISLCSDKTIEISRRNGIPLYIQMKCISSLISFVTLLDGYYRLSAKWNFNLCKDFLTPTLQKLQLLKCHGPVGEEFSYEKLRKKRENKPGTYILRESEFLYNTYYLDLCVKERKKPVTFEIEYRAEGHFWFSGDESNSYESISAIIKHFRKETIRCEMNELCLTECIPPSEYDESILLLCRDDHSKNKSDISSKPVDPCTMNFPLILPFKQLHRRGRLPEGRKGITEVSICSWHKDQFTKLDITLKILRPEYRDKYLESFLNQIGEWALLRSSSVVRLIGTVLGIPDTCGMITEYLPLGPLNKYLQENENMKTIDLIEAATYLAKAVWHLDEERIVHGNIRCHKVLVALHSDDKFSVRLADPGIPKPYTEHDYHWIPPEFHDKPEKARKSSSCDIWAFGTTLWQIFSLGQEPSVPDGSSVTEFYKVDGRLLQPKLCPGEVFRLISHCWHYDPHHRKRPQSAMRDINQLLFQVCNVRRRRSYAIAKPPNKSTSVDTLDDISSSALDDGFGEIMFNEDHNTLSSYGLPGFNSDLPTALCTTSGTTEVESILEGLPGTIPYEGGIIEVQSPIGQGFYGIVFKGILKKCTDNGISQLVAVKKIKEPRELFRSDFKKEISIMKMLNHQNIVAMIAVIQVPELILVMEYVEHGSLCSYIKMNKEKLSPTDHFLKYSLDIAEGMKYLGEKQIVHRDLACRNILVVNEYFVKISDFGLAQFTDHDNYYFVKTSRYLPIKWHAPESLGKGKFSCQSDVWSYGVTLFEIFSYGKDPVINHKGCEKSANLLLEALSKGFRLPYPDECPLEVYKRLMVPCWKYEAKLRPSFSEIISVVNDLRINEGIFFRLS